MSKFVDKNALHEIIMEVRDGTVSNKKGLKKIFKLLLSLHGRVGVIDGEVIYNPNLNAYLDYMDHSSWIIKMPDGDGSSVSRSMRLAILEDQQQWEIRVGEQICSQINDALEPFEIEERMLLLEQYINGMTLDAIAKKYCISRTSVYYKTKLLRAYLMNTFNLHLRSNEENCLLVIKKYLENTEELALKKECQDKVNFDLEVIEWEKSL